MKNAIFACVVPNLITGFSVKAVLPCRGFGMPKIETVFSGTEEQCKERAGFMGLTLVSCYNDLIPLVQDK